MDPLSQVLRLLNLKGCVYFAEGFRAPWGMTVPTGDVAQFHMVQRGTCRVRHAGEEILLSTGDFVVFPQGSGHQLYEGEPTVFVDGQDVLRAVNAGRKIFVDGQRATTRILCGHFEIERSFRHPLTVYLPEVVNETT